MTWKSAVAGIITTLPRDFALADVLACRGELQAMFPANHFVDAKIRQSLQVLRDQGVLQFLGGGRYRRRDIEPTFSPLIDFTAAAEYVNRSQTARVALETWVSFNLYCLNCQTDALDALPPNTPVADFSCAVCRTTYQVKSRNGRFGDKIIGAAYGPILSAVRSGATPEYVLIEFDARFGTVVFVDAIPGRLISEDRIIPRRPLKAGARRAGWQGCHIKIGGLPSVRLVAPAGIERESVRTHWEQIRTGGYLGSQ